MSSYLATSESNGLRFSTTNVVDSQMTGDFIIQYKDKNNATFSGVLGELSPTTHIYGTTTTLVDATKDGYYFNGWFLDSGCTGAVITELEATSYTSGITLYTKWSIEPADPTPVD